MAGAVKVLLTMTVVVMVTLTAQMPLIAILCHVLIEAPHHACGRSR